jgi:hypothetical protein
MVRNVVTYFSSPLQMLFHRFFIQLHACEDGRDAGVLDIVLDHNADGLPELVDRENLMRSVFFEEDVDDMVLIHFHEFLNVASVDVFFIFLFELLEQLIVAINFFLVFVENYLQKLSTLALDADERDYLVDYVAFRVFFRIFKFRTSFFGLLCRSNLVQFLSLQRLKV